MKTQNKPKFSQQASQTSPLKPPKHATLLSQLTEVWYKKLKADGFVDIEVRKPRNPAMYNPYLADRSRQFRTLDITNKRAYFGMCTTFLNTFDFVSHFGKDSELMRTIWYLHCEAISYRGMIRYFQGLKIAKVENGALYPIPKELRFKRSTFFYFCKLHELLKLFNTMRYNGLQDEGYEDAVSGE